MCDWDTMGLNQSRLNESVSAKETERMKEKAGREGRRERREGRKQEGKEIFRFRNFLLANN